MPPAGAYVSSRELSDEIRRREQHATGAPGPQSKHDAAMARSAALVPVHLAEIEARPPIDLSRRDICSGARKGVLSGGSGSANGGRAFLRWSGRMALVEPGLMWHTANA